MYLNSRAGHAAFVGILLTLWPMLAAAHNPFADLTQGAVIAGALLLLALWGSYCLGCVRLPPKLSRFWLFQAACLLSVFTLFGPLDEWAETNSAAHMVQHMLMMVVIAPLWVIARPLPQWHALQSMLANTLFAPLLQLARYPVTAATVHGAVIWFWHTPRFYVLALDNLWWHLVEHLCFMLSAGVFWWSVLRSQQTTAPRALLALLVTLMHTGFLGALLTFSHASWYGSERALEYQQLAGLLMWVLGGVPYFAAAGWLSWRWFNRAALRE